MTFVYRNKNNQHSYTYIQYSLARQLFILFLMRMCSYFVFYMLLMHFNYRLLKHLSIYETISFVHHFNWLKHFKMPNGPFVGTKRVKCSLLWKHIYFLLQSTNIYSVNEILSSRQSSLNSGTNFARNWFIVSIHINNNRMLWFGKDSHISILDNQINSVNWWIILPAFFN